MADNKDLSLEEAFSKIEESLAKMEEEDVSLEDSFKLYEEGLGLVKICNDKIDRVEKQMIVLGETYKSEE
ncbi:MAG: exodeoxyribonuclease VII small subunit [Eubacterium sp.]|nr:exodeoxyribonuclease VII small subunit [Eubacterium sp.]